MCCLSLLSYAAEKECGLEEMVAGISCVEPNFEEIAKHPLGSKENPVRADRASGQRAYLSRLVCTDGNPIVNFSRTGSVGVGPYGFILDLYVVLCDTKQGEVEHEVYMDFYHRGYIENEVAAGFGSIRESL